MVKFCIDCANYTEVQILGTKTNYTKYYCDSKIPAVSLVTGIKCKLTYDPAEARENELLCGFEAKWFVKK